MTKIKIIDSNHLIVHFFGALFYLEKKTYKKSNERERKMKKTKKLLSLLLSAALLVSMVACGSKDAADANDQQEVVEAGGEQSAHYPVEITSYNYEGDEITTVYEAAPEKVLAVYQGSIETLLKLGLADRIVAASGLDNEVSDDLKADFATLNYLDVFAPSKEDAVMMQPDMIFSWGSLFGEKNLGDVDYWIENGTNTYINSNTRRGGHDRTLENEYTDILNLGKIFDVEEKAEALVNEMKAEVQNVIDQTKDAEAKKTVMVLEPISGSITNYGAKSLGGNMVEALGAELSAPEASDVGKEDIINADPEVIFVVYMAYSGEDGEDVKQSQLKLIMEDPALASLQAVKNGNVYPIMLGDMYASGIRTMDGISTFARGIFPELY